jgi:hypothetical protein
VNVTEFGSRPSDLRRAAEDFAASLRVAGGDMRWEPRLPDRPWPGAWAALIARVAPGTLAGTLRVLAPEGGDGFDMRDERERHDVPNPESLEKGDLPEPLLWVVRQRRDLLVASPGRRSRRMVRRAQRKRGAAAQHHHDRVPGRMADGSISRFCRCRRSRWNGR